MAPAPQRGFSLIEVMVASAVFLLIMIAVYQVYMRSLEGHKLGVNQAELIQSTRFGFQEMATRIRSAGFEFDLDGVPSSGPNQSDESIEYMGETAIAVRANYDFASEALRGREPLYEPPPPVAPESCCPIVTTGNDEILVFALGKDEGAPNQPNESMTLYMDLDAPRDGWVTTDTGLIVGEDEVTIPNVALTNFDDPPYVLYQFTWTDPDDSGGVSLQRRPLVDNILSLKFQYFDEGGNDLALGSGGNPIALPLGGPNPSVDGDPATSARNRRERVRMVKIALKAMTPDPDLRYVDQSDTNPVTRKHRKWDLVEEVHTFNVGRRGQKDKDVDPPESVTDVQLCSGQCGMVRVDWAPGPPEDRISDHIVILASCPGGTNPNYDTPLASFIVVSDLDLTVDPEREYAVFDSDDDPDLVAGLAVCARVIARDASGAESELPSDSNNNTFLDPDTNNDFTIIQDYTRSEAPKEGQGSGYDWRDNLWPKAERDNDSGLAIQDDSAKESYPLENRIRISFATPRFTLDRLTEGGAPLYNWTTKEDVGEAALKADVDPGETCHRLELSPDDGAEDFRTPLEELARSANSSRPNVYVFRVSGSDDSNWGPEQGTCASGGASCVDEPRNFMPHAGNLHAFYSASMSGTRFNFEDLSESFFFAPEGVTDPYEERYVSTGVHAVKPGGGLAPVKALTPGEVYYYRVRVVDNCWNDSDRDGVEDSSAGTATEIAAWSTADDFANADDWREAAVRISPFYPPLLRLGESPGNRDRPASDNDDSDGVDLGSLSAVDTYALPAYAIPAWVSGSTYVRPEKPTEFYLSRANDSASGILPRDGSGNPGVRVLFNSAKRTAPQDTAGSPSIRSVPVGYSWYRLMRKAVTYTRGTAMSSGLDFEADTAGVELIAEFRLSDAGLRDYTIDRRAEVLGGKNSVLDNAGLYLTNSGGPYYYKLFTAQVTTGDWHDGTGGSDPLEPHVFDDGITPDSARYSIGSRGFLWPAEFYDQVAEVDVTPNPSSGLAAISVAVEVAMDPAATGGDPANCEQVRSARLLAYAYDTNEFVGSSDWMTTPATATPADCNFSFGSSFVEQALRTFPDRTRFRVELSEVNEPASSGGADWDKQPQGARVRSDLVGEAGNYELSTTCATNCGDNTVAGAGILGAIADDELSTEDGDRVLVLEIPVSACNTQDFSLLQLDLALDRGGQTMPAFISANLAGLRSGSLTLPEPEFSGDDGANYRLRWFEGSFCDASGFCEFPVVDADSTTLELRLRFAGPTCDPIRLLDFNFRVLVDEGAGLQELLCSNRGEFAPDSPGSADEPDYYCSTSGVSTDDCGRGPALNPEPCGQNPNCETNCPAGVCPLNSDFSIDPETFLEGDAIEGADSRVEIKQLEDCSDCGLEPTEIIARFECDAPGRDCSVELLPGFLSADFIQYDAGGSELSRDPLPAPTTNDSVPNDHVELTWSGLSGFEVLPGLSFSVEFLFDGSMLATKATTWHLTFGAPLEATVDCDIANELPIPSN